MIGALFHDRSGGTAIEYALIAACIAILIISALTNMGLEVESMFEAVGKGFDGVAP